MLRYVFSRRAFFVAIAFFLLVVGGSLLYSWDIRRSTESELGQTLKIKQHPENQNAADTAADIPPSPGETADSGHWHGDVWHSTPHAIREDRANMEVIDTPETQESPFFNLESPETGVDRDIPWEETADAQRLTQKLLKEWEDFGYDLKGKYSVLFDQQALEKLAQTREGRQQIKSQAGAIVTETLDEFERLFSQIPSDFSLVVLDLLEEHFTENNQGLPQKYIDQALDQMRSKIN